MASGERLLREFAEAFRVRALCIFEAETAKLDSLGKSLGHLPECTLTAFIQKQNSDNPVSHVSVRLLRVNGSIIGALGFEGLEDAQINAGLLASLAAAAQEHARTFRKARDSAANADSAIAQAEAHRLVLLDALAQELKDPLSILLAASGCIRKAGSLDAQQLEMMETFEVEAARMGSLITRFLRVARLGHEDVHPRREVIDVAGVVAGVVNEYMRLSLDRRIVLEPGEDSLEALADAELLGLALSQLMDNACKYSLPGSEISVAVESKDGMIFIRVANSGSSIPESERGRVFERFYRGEEARRYTSGAGLGLYVARKIALALGGQLDLDAERPARGVAFYLSLPKAGGEPENSNTL